jgi:hypothetical protein
MAAPRDYGKTIAESPPPRWPQPVRAPAGAPNILIIMTDDVGFGSASAFGGPVPTPAFDALAKRGLRYNRFHTTAICSPTRASLLTGRYPQNVGIGYPTNWASGYEGYNSVIPKTAGALPRILRDARAIALPCSARGISRPNGKPDPTARSTAGRRALALTISTAFWVRIRARSSRR